MTRFNDPLDRKPNDVIPFSVSKSIEEEEQGPPEELPPLLPENIRNMEFKAKKIKRN